jgi:hypothetical protein
MITPPTFAERRAALATAILAGYGGGSARGYSPLTYSDVRDL